MPSVDTEFNPSDIGTKHLKKRHMLMLMALCNLRYSKGLVSGAVAAFLPVGVNAHIGGHTIEAIGGYSISLCVGVLTLITFCAAALGACLATRGTPSAAGTAASATCPDIKQDWEDDGTLLVAKQPDSEHRLETVRMRKQDRALEGTELAVEVIGGFLRDEIRAELRRRRLPVSGLKAELVVRLANAGIVDDGTIKAMQWVSLCTGIKFSLFDLESVSSACAWCRTIAA